MTPGTLVLLHTPRANAASWGDLPEMLRSYGFDVITPDVPDLDGMGYVARASLVIAATAPEVPLVLVGHGSAGPLLPAIAAAQRAAHRSVGAYVFVDASLPRQVRAPQPHEHEHVRVPQPDDAFQPHEHEAEPPAAAAPVPADWPDAPCGYLRTHADRTGTPPRDGADEHGQAVREATLRGWTVVQHEPPAAVAQTLSELIATL
ncbi:hypothetical protein [Actinomadura rupiterrae]|uniref:hypothetical protein n=1 Tax=Actinomadura rupiterrae TaxID=559627 RepID=UPI0020A2B049|nr:hypothetical protein [Actinomadura rupiterrae]MCP2337778.1 hypothetical protein [Actinomadura rupiterrae]